MPGPMASSLCIPPDGFQQQLFRPGCSRRILQVALLIKTQQPPQGITLPGRLEVRLRGLHAEPSHSPQSWQQKPLGGHPQQHSPSTPLCFSHKPAGHLHAVSSVLFAFGSSDQVPQTSTCWFMSVWHCPVALSPMSSPTSMETCSQLPVTETHLYRGSFSLM